MRRIPVGLTDAQHERLRREATKRRKSVGALIRDAVDHTYPEDIVARREARARARAVFGGFHSGRGDVSERHDDYLAELERW